MTISRLATHLSIAIAAASASASAIAQSAAREPWTWRATMYAWLPSIHSTSQLFDVDGGSISTEVNPDGYLSHLKFVFMGTLEARNARWSFVGDVLYLHLADMTTKAKIVMGPAGAIQIPVDTSLDTAIKGFVGTFAAGYAVASSPDTIADVIAGVRYAHLASALDWRFGASVTPISQAGSVEASKNFTDAIVGVRGRGSIGGNWFLPYHLDAGAGSSRLTWQAAAGIGYRYSWGDVTLLYRHLAYEFRNDRPMSNLRLSGPQIGASFSF